MKTLPTMDDYEYEALLRLLRVAYHAELDKVHTDPQWASYHRQEARFAVNVLEKLNPKGIAPRPTVADLVATLQATITTPTQLAA